MRRPSELGMLLLHALPLDKRMWTNQLQIMPETTVAPNLYKFGCGIEQWAAKSLDLVAQDRLVVVGCSVGGSCALEIINLAPDRVAGAVLIGTKARCDPNPTAHLEACKTVEERGVSGAWDRYWKHLFDDDDVSVAQCAKEITTAQTASDLVNGLHAFYTRNSREDVVAQSATPIHIVTGARDPLPGLSYARHLAGLSDMAHLHVIKDCGHYVPMMQPMALNSIITGVIRDADADSKR